MSDELRKLADEHVYPLVGWETRLVDTLRRAADALDNSWPELLQQYVIERDLARKAEAERDNLRRQLDAAAWTINDITVGAHVLAAERDALRRKYEGLRDSARLWDKADEELKHRAEKAEAERDELQRQLSARDRELDDYIQVVVRQVQATQKAEAMAKRYRDALEDHCHGPDGDLARKALSDTEETSDCPGPGFVKEIVTGVECWVKEMSDE